MRNHGHNQNKENSLQLQEIRKIHTEFPLSGTSKNTSLQMPEKLIIHIISLLKNKPSSPPSLSVNEWNDLISKLGIHFIFPLMYRRFGSFPEQLQPPEEIIGKIRKEFLNTRAYQLQAEQQLSEIISSFEKYNIRVLVLKGPALARSVYPDPAMRPSADIDLLVLPQTVIRSRKILEHLGYECKTKIFEFFRHTHCEEAYVPIIKSRTRQIIELHWDFHKFSGINREIEIDDLFSRAITVKTPSFTFKTLHPVDALIQLAIHLVLVHTRDIRLIWIYDIGLVAQRLTVPDDWKALQERSVTWKARLALEKALQMAQLWVGLKIPQEFKNFSLWPKPSQDEILLWKNSIIGQQTLFQMFRSRIPSSLSLSEKARYVFRLIFPPSNYIRMRFPPSREWLLPISYIRRWWKFIKK